MLLEILFVLHGTVEVSGVGSWGWLDAFRSHNERTARDTLSQAVQDGFVHFSEEDWMGIVAISLTGSGADLLATRRSLPGPLP